MLSVLLSNMEGFIGNTEVQTQDTMLRITITFLSAMLNPSPTVGFHMTRTSGKIPRVFFVSLFVEANVETKKIQPEPFPTFIVRQ